VSDCTGTFYDGEGALAHPAVLQWSDENSDVCVVLEDLNEERRYAQEDVHVDAPLGADSPRTVVFKDGARFYTESGAQLDGLVPRGAGKWKNPHQWASRLERHKHAIVLSIVMLLAFLFVSYRYGIPAVADSLAYKLPHSTLEAMSENTTDVLDKYFGFKPTELAEDVQDRLQVRFDELVEELGSPGYRYALEFRNFGVNAFALPSGTIIVGDQLVDAMPDDEAIIAVMVHEIAHVEKRHGTRQVLREAGVAFLIGVALGDMGTSAGILTALPQVMLSSGYSRGFETEADLFAADYLIDTCGHSEPMAAALEALGEAIKDMEIDSLGWVSSHPLTDDRIRKVRSHGAP